MSHSTLTHSKHRTLTYAKHWPLLVASLLSGACSGADDSATEPARDQSEDENGSSVVGEESEDIPKATSGESCSTHRIALEDQAQGDEACGLNGRGVELLKCESGKWTAAGACLDPDECVDGETRPGPAFCGSFGKLDEECVDGSWEDSGNCVEGELPSADGFQLGDHSLWLGGGMSSDGTTAYLQWERQPDGVEVELFRRPMSAIGTESWESLGSFDGTDIRYVDEGLSVGEGYEYKVVRAASQTADSDYEYLGAGYWVLGSKVPYPSQRRIVLVYVDETLAPELGPELERLDQDLAGDGWTVKRRSFERHGTIDTARKFRSAVKSDYDEAPDLTKTALLIGRLPYVRSGPVAPDHHYPGTEVATDQFVADIDGTWTDSDEDGKFEDKAVPLPQGSVTATELRIGRADFANMNAWADDELSLTRAYLDKNHAYRQAVKVPQRRTIWDKLAYDDSPFEREAAIGFVGEDNAVQGDFKDNPDKPDDIHAEDPATSFQWGIDFSDWKGSNYPNYDFRIAFALNFGSGKQKWDSSNAPLRSMLCMKHFGLAAFWGVRPNWFIYHMGLGATLGDSQWRTVNANEQDYPSLDDYEYSNYERGVWINLMGDPTLRNFPVPPPSDVQARSIEDELVVSWTASLDSELVGYDVFRASSGSGPFERLNQAPILVPSYVDTAPDANQQHYMVRAVRLEHTAMGSYYNPSQGAFGKLDGQ